MLDAFKLKPFDLEPIYKAWSDGPRFLGNPKKDPPVEEWLAKIKAGCVERNVPKEYWHKVAQHYMGDKAKARLNELKNVMAKVHGGTYRWNWAKYKIAMRNMGWNVDASQTETIKVHRKPSGLWWIVQSKKDESPIEEIVSSSVSTARAPPPSRSDSFWITRKLTADTKSDKVEKVETKEITRRPPARRASTSGFWRKGPKNEDSSQQRPVPQKALSDVVVSTHPMPPVSTRLDAGETIVTHAPVWLLNACNALDFLQTEHPKVMSTISAILITAGTLPSIPAISAGAGGALLASSAAQAVGAIAVGVGSWLKAQQESQISASTSQSSSRSH